MFQAAEVEINWKCKYKHVPLILRDIYQNSGCYTSKTFILGLHSFYMTLKHSNGPKWMDSKDFVF